MGGVCISVPQSTEEAEQQQQQQQQPGGGGAPAAGGAGAGWKPRTKDKKPTKVRRCMACVKWGGDDNTAAMECKGRASGGTCQHWTGGGEAIQ